MSTQVIEYKVTCTNCMEEIVVSAQVAMHSDFLTVELDTLPYTMPTTAECENCNTILDIDISVDIDER